MINGMHLTLYGSEKTVDDLRAFMRDVLHLPSYDPGGGWLLFHLPGEIGCHPEEGHGRKPARYELSFSCDDIEAAVADLEKRGVKFVHEIHDAGWGRVTTFKMPGAITAMLYEPRHGKPGK